MSLRVKRKRPCRNNGVKEKHKILLCLRYVHEILICLSTVSKKRHEFCVKNDTNLTKINKLREVHAKGKISWLN